MTTAQHELFMVFVGGKPGLEQDYAAWFTGEHMGDMERLPGVESANAYRLGALDGQPVPASLCAVYETLSGARLLQTIATSKGTDALPVSLIQGAMIWRVLETVRRSEARSDAKHRVLICLFGGEWDGAEEERLWDWLGGSALPIVEARQTRISPVQPGRGREFGGVLFLTLAGDADAGEVVSAIRERREAAGSRFLLACPV